MPITVCKQGTFLHAIEQMGVTHGEKNHNMDKTWPIFFFASFSLFCILCLSCVLGMRRLVSSLKRAFSQDVDDIADLF